MSRRNVLTFASAVLLGAALAVVVDPRRTDPGQLRAMPRPGIPASDTIDIATRRQRIAEDLMRYRTVGVSDAERAALVREMCDTAVPLGMVGVPLWSSEPMISAACWAGAAG